MAGRAASVRVRPEDCASAALDEVALVSKKPEDFLAAARREVAGLDGMDSAIRKSWGLKAALAPASAELARDASQVKLCAQRGDPPGCR